MTGEAPLKVTVHLRGVKRKGEWKPSRDTLTPVYSRVIPTGWRHMEPDLLAELLFWVFRVNPAEFPNETKSLDDEEAAINLAYRKKRLRPFVIGDVLEIGTHRFQCGPWGHAIPRAHRPLT